MERENADEREVAQIGERGAPSANSTGHCGAPSAALEVRRFRVYSFPAILLSGLAGKALEFLSLIMLR